MATPATWKGVIAHFKLAPADIRTYFESLPSLIEHYSWEIPISYQFSRIELAHNMTLHCGVVKLHKVDAILSHKAIEKHHITRKHFLELFETIYDKKLDPKIVLKLNEAEEIRDKVLHGKSATPAEMRKAVVDVIDYATQFNEFVESIAGIRPFGNLKGFKGRSKSLGMMTSRWVLRGIGFVDF